MSAASGRRGRAWAIIGGIVLVVGFVAIIVASTISQSPGQAEPTHTDTAGASSSPTPTPGTVVDPTASAHGWAPEPVTTDADAYIRAALEAASTFDTQKSTRDQWLSYLDSWFTPDTRYQEPDRADRMKAAQLELRQGVVLPRDDWDSLAAENGRVVAVSASEVTHVPVSGDASGDMRIGTTDVTLTFTRSDASGNESSYDEHARVSVQVLCGDGSLPTPDTPQTAGDCKVVRYFTEPMEP
ncbi:hypothetical protein [Microbacterium sp.]|uniref:hypothetical protein n=1 Tax=Microbacterium sp. TaxID=51671 RepID=UPI003A8FB624